MTEAMLQDQVAEENQTYQALEQFWHPVCYSDQLKDKPLRARLMGKNLVVARLKDGILVALDRCPHKGAALSLGKIIDGTKLECPYHGWQFGCDGACIRIPAREELTTVMNRKVDKFHAQESAGIVWVCLAKEPKLELPAFPEFDDPEFRVLQGPAYRWATSTPRRLENFVDFAHFAFVHDGSIGSRDNPRVEPVKVWREGHALRFDRGGIMEPGDVKKKELLGLPVDEWYAPTNNYHVYMPHTVHLKRTFPNGKRYILFMSASPTDATTTTSFWWQARDFGTEEEHDDFFMQFELDVLAEDKPIIQSQTPIQMNLAGELAKYEMPVRGADVVTVEYRRWLLELTKDFAK